MMLNGAGKKPIMSYHSSVHGPVCVHMSSLREKLFQRNQRANVIQWGWAMATGRQIAACCLQLNNCYSGV